MQNISEHRIFHPTFTQIRKLILLRFWHIHITLYNECKNITFNYSFNYTIFSSSRDTWLWQEKPKYHRKYQLRHSLIGIEKKSPLFLLSFPTQVSKSKSNQASQLKIHIALGIGDWICRLLPCQLANDAIDHSYMFVDGGLNLFWCTVLWNHI